MEMVTNLVSGYGDWGEWEWEAMASAIVQCPMSKMCPVAFA